MITVTRFDPGTPATRHPDMAASGWTRESAATLWIDLEAPTATELGLLESPFAFHPLAIEDCLTPEHQPKIEDFGPYLFLIFRGVAVDPPTDRFETIKLAAFLGPNYLITYHRRPMRSVAAVLTKYAHDEKGDLFRGVDYLLYEILDQLIEHYFPVLERLEGEIEAVEERIFSADDESTLDAILGLKRRVMEIKRALTPHRELFGRIARNEFEEITPQTVVFYRDLYDSTYRLAEVADSYRDVLSGTLDAHISMVSHRLNEVMKVLTIFSTIMLPLTFIAGVYGMNFDFMPELHWRYGYFFVWGVMLAVTGGLLLYFRRRRWI
ncbi:MAG TPA: magnesium/cobalt transporter CorA [Gemmatimonadota bacterium]|nr:magnesium/cobalt transporter CorA [Gemmatimonadota bacterium]